LKRRNFLKLGLSSALVYLAGETTHAMPLGSPTTSGRQRLSCRWEARKKGKYICDLSAATSAPFLFTQMFVNGEKEVRARFPDVDSSGASQYLYATRVLPPNFIRPDFDDGSQDAIGIEFDPATFSQKRWAKPEEAIVYVRHQGGDVAVAMRTIDYDRNILWCTPESAASVLVPNSAPQFYIENVYEETNAVHEWYLFRDTGTLYYLPPSTLDINSAVIEMA